MEVIYRDLFVRELQRLGIEDRFFPVGAAANHSLLYLVLRCYLELPLRRILDVGAGQTSLLLDALQRKLGKAEIVTLEHDTAWAERIASQVGHPVLRRDLVPMRIGGQATLMHDIIGIEGPFQLIIMDAPPGVRRYSRLGLVHLMQTVLDRGDFVAILDDTERGGEWQTVQACRQWLRESGVRFRQVEVRAAKRQWLCAGGALGLAAYF
jgi:predicted RNA methylase